MDLLDTIVACRKCPRLVAYREQVARIKKHAYMDWVYWGKPVPGFGDLQARVLVVGLAPGAHGSNRTGRMFTGDSSGVFLYRALHRAGFANQPTSLDRDDGLALHDMFISAVCRCAPPGNKPSPSEINNCLPYLEQEIGLLKCIHCVVALGRVAFDNVIRLYQSMDKPVSAPMTRLPTTPKDFKHGASYRLGEGLPWLVASYHPSRQNTQTGRLTEAMFDDVWIKAKECLMS